MAFGIAPGFQQIFVDGAPAQGYKLLTYLAGTTTEQDTYKDVDGGVTHANPIVLDDQGMPPGANLFLDLDVLYDFVLVDASDAPVAGLAWDSVRGVPPQADETFLPLSGGTMTGPIDLAGDAESSLEPVTLQQMQDAISAAVATATATILAQGLQIGDIIARAATTGFGSNFLVCDGAAVSRSTYADLFAAVGTTWGVGNGTSTFNLPDFRGMFLRGLDSMGTQGAAGVDSGRTLGDEQDEAIGPHTHFVAVDGDTGSSSTDTLTNANTVSESALTGGNRSDYLLQGTTGPADSGLTSDGGGAENRPINQAVVWLIRAT